MIEPRDARPDEQLAIRELVEGIAAEYGYPPEPEGADRDLYDAFPDYFAPTSLCRVVERDGELVGMLGVVHLEGRTWELRKIYLRPSERGSGLGRKLLDEALAFCRAQDAERIVLQTATRLKEAVRLYERAGFQVQNGEGRSSTCDLRMELGLER